MIDPDIHNINLIPESKLTLIEIENVSKIKTQNAILRNSIILIFLVAGTIALRNYYINRKKDLNQ
jgi:hypothetical protein